MRNLAHISLSKTLLVHNVFFLFFFFAMPKFYIYKDIGLRGEDIMYPATFLLFLAVLPKLKKLEFPKLHNAIIAYFAYIFLQGLMLSPFTGGFKYFIVIFFKQLQYFMFFYMLLYTFQFYNIKDKTMKFISFLVGANLLSAAWQILLGQQTSFSRRVGHLEGGYGIGALGENFPHQAAAIFLFCFIFSYIRKELRFRRAFITLSAAAILMTISRTTIVALAVCILYILATEPKIKNALKKPAVILPLAIIMLITGYTVDTILTSAQVPSYTKLKSRGFSTRSFSRGAEKRLPRWTSDLKREHYSSYAFMNPLTGMGRGYDNVIRQQWRLAGDSGYIRDFMEIGIIGLFLHLYVFLAAGKYIGLKKYLLVFLPYLSISITYEAFIVSKSGIVILILTAIMISEKNINKKGIE